MKHERLHSDLSHSKAESRKTVRRMHGGNVVAFARERGVAQERILDFSAGINPCGHPSAVKAAYKRAMLAGDIRCAPYFFSKCLRIAAKLRRW